MHCERNLTPLRDRRVALLTNSDPIDARLRTLTRDWFDHDLRTRVDIALERRLRAVLTSTAGLGRAA